MEVGKEGKRKGIFRKMEHFISQAVSLPFRQIK